MASKYLNIALESINNSTVEKENEIVIYGKIGKPEGLKDASSTAKHEQASGRFIGGQSCRVRKTTTTVDDVPLTEYTFTFKIRDNNKDYQSSIEYNSPVDKEFMEGFLKVAEGVVNKNRYMFVSKNVTIKLGSGDDTTDVEIPNITYEVDVFLNKDGSESKWCKVDIEVDGILEYLSANYPDVTDVHLNVAISNLPFDIEDHIVDMEPTDEQEDIINSIWDSHTFSPDDIHV